MIEIVNRKRHTVVLFPFSVIILCEKVLGLVIVEGEKAIKGERSSHRQNEAQRAQVRMKSEAQMEDGP